MKKGLELGPQYNTRVPIGVKNFLSQKIFQLFFKIGFSVFQDSGIILSEKKFSEFQTNLSSGIAMRSQRQKLPLTCNQRKRTLPVRITWKGDWTSGVYCSARVSVEIKNFLSQKIFQLFFKTCLLHVSGLSDNFKRKKFSDFQTNLSSGIAMRSQRQKLPLTCNQRKRTGPRVSHCGARVSVEVKNFLSQKIFYFFSKRVFLMFQDSRIILSEKNFSDFQTNLSPGIAIRSQRQKIPLTCNQRRRTLPVRITWKGDWTSGVYCSARVSVEVKNFLSQKIYQLFFKTCLLHVSGLSDNFRRKKFFRLSDQSEFRYRNEIPKAETPPYL